MDVTELIITLVRENECLYAKTHPHYKNVAKKKLVYHSISEKLRSVSGMEMSAENIERRWSSLRDMFSRAHRNLKLQSSGSGYVPIKKWNLYENMNFLIPHISHRRSKSNFVKSAPTGEQQSVADSLADDTPEAHILPLQSPSSSITKPQPFVEPLYSEDVSNTASIMTDHDYEFIETFGLSSSAVPLTPSSTVTNVLDSSSSSSTTPLFRPIARAPVVPEPDHYAKRRRKSSNEIEKVLDTATALLGKVVNDMVSDVHMKDPYLIAVEEGLKHVPVAVKTKCLIEILQVIDKYQEM